MIDAMSTDDPAAGLLAAVAASVRPSYAAVPGLGARIEAWIAEIGTRWPAVVIDRSELTAWIGARLPVDVSDPAATIANLRGAELGLAWACVRGDARAIAILEHEFLGRLDGPLRRLDRRAGLVDEVRSKLRQELLIGGPERRPTLVDYAGRGDLWSWLRIAAIRTALKLLRRDGRERVVEEDVLEALAVHDEDPELDHLRQRFRREFAAAFAEAVGRLEPRAKNVLLQHHLDGLTTDALAGLYRVHRVTVSRWLVQARAELLATTRASMMQRLALTPSECDSLIRLVRSQLDLTLQRVLGR